jgi:putative ABC transport system permease protein
MGSVALVAWNNLRRRKGQGFLVATVLSLAVLLFFAGVGLMLELSGPFERMYEELEGAHYSLIFDSRIHDPEQVRAWWLARPEAAAVGPALPAVQLDESAYVNGKNLSKFLVVSERLRREGLDRLRPVAGEVDEPPGHGEVWIPTVVAQETGITVGDTIELPGGEGPVSLEVAAVVVDPVFSAPFNSPTRVWVGPGELPFYYPISRLNEVSVAVRLQGTTGSRELWEEFLASLGGHFSGNRFDYEAVLGGYTAPYNLMAIVLVAFSAFSVLIALFAIHGTITSAVLADFKVIGILRAQGFRPLDVRRTYQLQYLALAVAAVPLGVAAGVPAVRVGVSLLMGTIGAGAQGSSLLPLALATAVGFLLLVLFFVSMVARRAERVRPADAIRFGADRSETVQASRLRIARLGRLPLPMILALKGLVTQRRRLAFLVLSVFFATLAASLAIHLDYSFKRGREDLGVLGFDSADVRLTRAGARFGIRHERLIEAMNARDDVMAIATWDYLDATLLEDEGEPGADLTGTVVAGDMEGLGFRNMRGRHPEGADEVALAVNTAIREEKDLGDEVVLHMLGQRLRLRVTGVYQTLNNGGTGFRVRLAAVRRANPLYSPVQYGVVLAEGADADTFIERVEGEYGEALDAKPGDFFVREIMDTVTAGMRVSNGFLSLVFLAAASVFIFNSTLMNIAENRRMYGILKTVGMTPAELRSSVVWGVAVQSSLGVALGLIAWELGGGAGLSALFAGLGLVAFPVQSNMAGVMVLVPVILLFCLASAWLPSRRLLRLDPKGLIVE